jgi:hypothetical protein
VAISAGVAPKPVRVRRVRASSMPSDTPAARDMAGLASSAAAVRAALGVSCDALSTPPAQAAHAVHATTIDHRHHALIVVIPRMLRRKRPATSGC